MHDSKLHDDTWEGDDDMRLFSRWVDKRRADERRRANVVGDLMASAMRLQEIVRRVKKTASETHGDLTRVHVEAAYADLRAEHSAFGLALKRAKHELADDSQMCRMMDSLHETTGKLITFLRTALDDSDGGDGDSHGARDLESGDV